MSGRRRAWILGLAAALVAVVVLSIILLRPTSQEPPESWGADVRFSVRVLHRGRTVDVELTEQPIVSGRVAYEGPQIAEGEPNWKPGHTYRGADLGAVVDRAFGLGRVDTVTLVALDGWHKTVPRGVLDGATAAGPAVLALSVDDEPAVEWDDAPMLVFLPEDERFSNADMLDALGPEYAHSFGDAPSTTGLMVKGIVFLVINHDGGDLPSLSDL